MQVYSIGEALLFREQERDNFVVIDKAAFRAMQGKATMWDARDRGCADVWHINNDTSARCPSCGMKV